MRDESYFESRNLTAGQLNAIVKKLGGEWGALQYLRGEFTTCPTGGPFPRWMKLSNIGNTSGTFLVQHVEEKHMRVDGGASRLLLGKAFKPHHGSYWGYLVAPLPSDLGLDGAPTYTEVLERGMDCGLELCDPAIGPMLRAVLDHNHPECRYWYSIAMKPIDGQYFRLTHQTSDGTLSLETDRKNRNYLKGSCERVVFFIRP